MRALVNVLAELGSGLFEITPDSTGDRQPRDQHFAALRDIAVESGRPVTFILANAPHHGDAWIELLGMVDETIRRGGRMTIQALARQVRILLSFKTQLPFDKLPTWSRVRRQSLAEQRRALEDGPLRDASR